MQPNVGTLKSSLEKHILINTAAKKNLEAPGLRSAFSRNLRSVLALSQQRRNIARLYQLYSLEF